MDPTSDHCQQTVSSPYQKHFHHSRYNVPSLPPLHDEAPQQERSPRTSASMFRRSSHRSGITERSYSESATSTRRNSPQDHPPLSPVKDDEPCGGFTWACPEPTERPQRHSSGNEKTSPENGPEPPFVGLPVSPAPWRTSFPREQPRPEVERSYSVPQPHQQQPDTTERRKSRGFSSKVKSAWGGLFKKDETPEGHKVEARHWTDEDY